MIRVSLGHVYRNLEQYFCAFLMVLMVFCLGAQVFFRFVLNASLTWSEELSRFAFIWLVYMGAVLRAKERIHIRTPRGAVPAWVALGNALQAGTLRLSRRIVEYRVSRRCNRMLDPRPDAWQETKDLERCPLARELHREP